MDAPADRQTEEERDRERQRDRHRQRQQREETDIDRNSDKETQKLTETDRYPEIREIYTSRETGRDIEKLSLLAELESGALLRSHLEGAL